MKKEMVSWYIPPNFSSVTLFFISSLANVLFLVPSPLFVFPLLSPFPPPVFFLNPLKLSLTLQLFPVFFPLHCFLSILSSPLFPSFSGIKNELNERGNPLCLSRV